MPGKHIIPGDDGQQIYLRTALDRESVWEVLDNMPIGHPFTSHQLWLQAHCRSYQQAVIVLRKSRDLGWVRKISYGVYERVK